MRTVDEIKEDIENYKINKRPNDGSEIEVYALQKELCHTLIGKIPLDRLEEICNAEREGRCAVLPCRIGDAVRATILRPFNGHEVTIHGTVTDVQSVIRVQHSGIRYVDFLASDFGKTVFLTNKDAEIALKEREQIEQ